MVSKSCFFHTQYWEPSMALLQWSARALFTLSIGSPPWHFCNGQQELFFHTQYWEPPMALPRASSMSSTHRTVTCGRHPAQISKPQTLSSAQNPIYYHVHPQCQAHTGLSPCGRHPAQILKPQTLSSAQNPIHLSIIEDPETLTLHTQSCPHQAAADP